MTDLDRPTTIHRHAGDVRALAFFPDNRTLASAGSDGEVQIRTVAGKPSRSRKIKLPGGVTALAVAGEGKYLITGNGNGTVYVLRLGERRP
jgi:WD40 repeat protein